jgi:hypothetical protein
MQGPNQATSTAHLASGTTPWYQKCEDIREKYQEPVIYEPHLLQSFLSESGYEAAAVIGYQARVGYGCTEDKPVTFGWTQSYIGNNRFKAWESEGENGNTQLNCWCNNKPCIVRNFSFTQLVELITQRFPPRKGNKEPTTPSELLSWFSDLRSEASYVFRNQCHQGYGDAASKPLTFTGASGKTFTGWFEDQTFKYSLNDGPTMTVQGLSFVRFCNDLLGR